MKNTGMMAVLSAGSTKFVMPLEEALETMKLLAGKEVQEYRNVDGSYRYVITPQSEGNATVEVRVLPHMEYARDKAYGDKYMEEESKSA